jgi:Zn-dependent M28 family amino/carboxypeptidase
MSKQPIKITCIICALFALTALTLVTQPFSGATNNHKQAISINESSLKAHVKYLSVDAHPRSYSNPAKLAAAADYIEAQLKAVGANPTRQAVVVEGKTFHNIITRFGPATGEVIVVGAHYDSHCHEEPCTPGADDNASGVAGLIELARLLAKLAPPQPVELVAYTLEEPPHFRTEHMGSAWHANTILQSKRHVKLMMSLEMIGYFSDASGSQNYPVSGMQYLYSHAGDYVAVVGKFSDFGNTRKIKSLMRGASPLKVLSINAPAWIQGIDFSDHLSYWDAGIPAVMITDTAFMRNKQYHLAGDTYDKLDYKRMAQVVHGVYAVVQHF